MNRPLVLRLAGLVPLALLALTACSGGASGPDATSSGTRASATSSGTSTGTARTPSASPTPTPTPTPGADLSLEEKVGQLLMVGVPATGADDATYALVRDEHIGNVYLGGRSTAGVDATADVAARFTALADDGTTGGVPMWVATDQEGGLVQVLRGPGFSDIPSAQDQAGLSPSALEQAATGWGAELAAAGVNLDLAPVADVVPAGTAQRNAPIGYFGRQYGSDAQSVTPLVNAFTDGLWASGVGAVVKHFPGLGLVDENTDTTSGVTDSGTDAGSPSVDVFRASIANGARVVMMSTAIYTRLDPDSPAAFSEPVVTGLLREQLGFEGVCMTDDVGAAKQVADIAPVDRAVRTIEAGCDVVLASASTKGVPAVVDALVAKAKDDPEFAAKVDASVARVLTAKQQLRVG